MRVRGTDSLTIVFTGPGQAELRVEHLRRSRPGQVLLDARCSLVSTGTERRCFERNFAPGTHWDLWVRYPFRPGYSFVGVTAEGARVCANAPHAQRAIVAKKELLSVPDDVSDEDASWFALAAIAQHGLAQSRLEPGDAVAVVGAGVLGQLVAQLARAAGAGEVIVVARSRSRLDAAVSHGATAVAASAAEASDAVLSRTNGEGASIVFDVTGSEAVLADAMKLARRGGMIVLLGDVGNPGGQRLGPELLLADLHVVGAHITNVSTSDRRRMAEEFFAAVGDGRVVVGDLITSRVRPEDAPAVYASLADGDPARLGVLFDWRRDELFETAADEQAIGADRHLRHRLRWSAAGGLLRRGGHPGDATG